MYEIGRLANCKDLKEFRFSKYRGFHRFEKWPIELISKSLKNCEVIEVSDLSESNQYNKQVLYELVCDALHVATLKELILSYTEFNTEQVQ